MDCLVQLLLAEEQGSHLGLQWACSIGWHLSTFISSLPIEWKWLVISKCLWKSEAIISDEKALICSCFFPCELSACVSIISYTLTQILSQCYFLFGVIPPEMSLDGSFFLSTGKKIDPENILAMQSTINLYSCLYAKEKDLSNFADKQNLLILKLHCNIY